MNILFSIILFTSITSHAGLIGCIQGLFDQKKLNKIEDNLGPNEYDFLNISTNKINEPDEIIRDYESTIRRTNPMTFFNKSNELGFRETINRVTNKYFNSMSQVNRSGKAPNTESLKDLTNRVESFIQTQGNVSETGKLCHMRAYRYQRILEKMGVSPDRIKKAYYVYDDVLPGSDWKWHTALMVKAKDPSTGKEKWYVLDQGLQTYEDWKKTWKKPFKEGNPNSIHFIGDRNAGFLNDKPSTVLSDSNFGPVVNPQDANLARRAEEEKRINEFAESFEDTNIF